MLDRFHIVQRLNKAVDQVRVAEVKGETAREGSAMRKAPMAARVAFLGAVGLLGSACKSHVPDRAQETQLKIVDLTQRLEQRLVLSKCLPLTLDAWMSEDASIRRYAEDGWGRPFVLRADGHRVTVASAGFDGVFGSDDDVEGDAVVTPHGVPSCSPPEARPDRGDATSS